MKKTVFILLLSLFTLTAVGQSYKYASMNLNLRSGPGTSYQVLTTVPARESVKLVENRDCVWVKVSYNSKVGYVNSKYLTDGQPPNYQNQNASTFQQNTNTPTKHYTNSAGKKVQSPTYYNSPPAGATALCRDGTYSFSRSRRGTCSHHGGVAKWLK